MTSLSTQHASAQRVRARVDFEPPTDGFTQQELYDFALRALRELTIGVEQEVFVIDRFAKLKNLSKSHPGLSLVAKTDLSQPDPPGFKDGKPDLGDGFYGAVNEALDSVREFITDPIVVRDAAGIRRLLEQFDKKINDRLARDGLLPLYSSLPVLIPDDGLLMTDDQRYRNVWNADPVGFEHGRLTASMQTNLGTLPPEIQGQMAGMSGDSSHLLLGVSAASPFRWTRVDEKANYCYELPENPGKYDSFLVDNGYASNRGPIWWMMETSTMTPVAYDNTQWDSARDQHIAGTFRVPGTDTYSFFHGQDRRQPKFGVERRSPDSVPTIEERELLVILSIVDLVGNLQQMVNDPQKRQIGINERADAAEHAAIHGMTGDLMDPATGRPRNAYEVLRSRLDSVRAGLEAYERGDIEGVLDPHSQPVAAYDGRSTSTMFNRATEILDRLQILGSPAERARNALAHYRDLYGLDDSQAPHTSKGERIITRSEALFINSFTLAEQRMGLDADRDEVFEKAHDLMMQAEMGQLSFASPGISLN